MTTKPKQTRRRPPAARGQSKTEAQRYPLETTRSTCESYLWRSRILDSPYTASSWRRLDFLLFRLDASHRTFGTKHRTCPIRQGKREEIHSTKVNKITGKLASSTTMGIMEHCLYYCKYKTCWISAKRGTLRLLFAVLPCGKPVLPYRFCATLAGRICEGEPVTKNSLMSEE